MTTIEYELQYIFNVNGAGMIASEREIIEAERSDRVLQVKYQERTDEVIRRQHRNRLPINMIRYEGTRLFLGNPRRAEDYYSRNVDAADLVKLGLEVTAADVLRESRRRFGGKKPLVVLQLCYVNRDLFQVPS